MSFLACERIFWLLLNYFCLSKTWMRQIRLLRQLLGFKLFFFVIEKKGEKKNACWKRWASDNRSLASRAKKGLRSTANLTDLNPSWVVVFFVMFCLSQHLPVCLKWKTKYLDRKRPKVPSGATAWSVLIWQKTPNSLWAAFKKCQSSLLSPVCLSVLPVCPPVASNRQEFSLSVRQTAILL